jgi:hypothetical protein
MEKVMKGEGRDVEVVVYKGEDHGWEREDTIKASIEKEPEFCARTLL